MDDLAAGRLADLLVIGRVPDADSAIGRVPVGNPAIGLRVWVDNLTFLASFAGGFSCFTLRAICGYERPFL